MKNALFLFAIVLAVSTCAAGQSLAKIETELLGHLNALEKASNYGGTSDYDVMAKENQALRSALLKYGTRADVLAYSFPKLARKWAITTSSDRKLRAYSWDSEEGGTMHDFVTVYQFRTKSGKTRTWADPYTQSMEGRGGGAYVQDIFETDTNQGTIYLEVAAFIGSTSFGGQIISALKIDGEKLDRDPKVIRTRSGMTSSISFEYDFFSVVDHPERPVKLVYFDASKKAFRFPIVIQDKRTPQGRVTNRFITYRYDGKHFVKVS